MNDIDFLAQHTADWLSVQFGEVRLLGAGVVDGRMRIEFTHPESGWHSRTELGEGATLSLEFIEVQRRALLDWILADWRKLKGAA